MLAMKRRGAARGKLRPPLGESSRYASSARIGPMVILDVDPDHARCRHGVPFWNRFMAPLTYPNVRKKYDFAKSTKSRVEKSMASALPTRPALTAPAPLNCLPTTGQ